jgi:2-methylcitrate dehydratase PrpD
MAGGKLHGGAGASTRQGPDASEIFAKHLARVTYADLPAPVIAAAKASILDTLACIYAGTACQDVTTVSELMQHWGGTPSCTVIGSGGTKLPPASAAFVNGAAIHQYDFDDTHDKAVCHPTSATLVPALAVAEEKGGVSGREILTAVALGNDIVGRVGLATAGRMFDHPWFRAPVIGLFGATVACAKILGANEEQHLNAFGLTLPQVSGTWASLHHKGSSVRSIRDGLNYRNGVLAAELAMRGIRGDKEVFDGPYGYYQAFFRGDYDRKVLLDGLGEHYETTRISLKPWPSIRHLHATLTAVHTMLERHRLAFDDIAQVVLTVGEINQDRCRPVVLGSVPANAIDLLGNMHFAVATLILHGGLPLSVYRETALADRVITTSMPKVTWQYDASFDGNWTFEPGQAAIVTKAGQRYEARSDIALGHPDLPMSMAQQHAKFVACATTAARAMPEAQARQIIALVDRLETLDDIAPLMRLLA